MDTTAMIILALIAGVCAGIYAHRLFMMAIEYKVPTKPTKFDGVIVLDTRNNEYDESTILLDIKTKEELFKREYICLKVNVRR